MTEPKPGIKLDGRSPSDPQVGLADQVVALIPTPNAVDGDGKGSAQQSVASLMEGKRQQHLTDFPRLLEIHGGDPGAQLELFHTPDTMPDAPNKGSNTRSKPAGVGNQVKELFPTPGARDGGRGPRSDEAVAAGTGQPSLLDVGKLLPREEPELLPTPTSSQGRNETSGRQPGSRHNTGTTLNDVVFKGDIAATPLLPTPRTSDCKGTDSPGERNRKSPGLGAINYHLTGGEDDAPLLSTPQARDWKGVPGDTYNSYNLARDINNLVKGDRDVALLPTPGANDGNGGHAPKDPDAEFRPSGHRRQKKLPEVARHELAADGPEVDPVQAQIISMLDTVIELLRGQAR